jgi:hypothetical protein
MTDARPASRTLEGLSVGEGPRRALEAAGPRGAAESRLDVA